MVRVYSLKEAYQVINQRLLGETNIGEI